MSDAFGGQPFPRGVLIAVALLLSFVIIMVGVARLTGFMMPQAPLAPEAQAIDIRFLEEDDGSMGVYEAGSGTLLTRLPPGGEGFIRGVLRSMERQRKGFDAPLSDPFHLARRQNGDLTLEDPTTGILIDLRAFGETNEAAFAELLSGSSGSQ